MIILKTIFKRYLPRIYHVLPQVTLQILNCWSISAIRILVVWKCFKIWMLLFLMQLLPGYAEYVFRMISRNQIHMRSSALILFMPLCKTNLNKSVYQFLWIFMRFVKMRRSLVILFRTQEKTQIIDTAPLIL